MSIVGSVTLGATLRAANLASSFLGFAIIVIVTGYGKLDDFNKRFII